MRMFCGGIQRVRRECGLRAVGMVVFVFFVFFFQSEDGIRDVAVTGSDVCFFFSSRRRHTRCSRDWIRRVLFFSKQKTAYEM